jgi:uncharacterized protein involved in exopolysaccharide biosynthesis
MQDLLNPKHGDEIDLRELFTILWAYKLFIACTCALGMVFAGYYSLNVEKKYNSEAIFRLDNQDSPSLLGGEGLSALANLAGFSGMTGSPSLPRDQVSGRIFIEKLDEKLNFQADPYFNTYNPNILEPIWKTFIKRLIGWQKSSLDVQEVIWQSVVANYVKNIEIEETDNGSIKIVFTHNIASRAAEIANAVMNEIISDTVTKRNTEQDQQLSYLSNTLAKALNDLEISQSNLKEFTLENSALPLESFAAGSVQLDVFREQLNRTTRLYEAVEKLSLMLENKTTDQKSYQSLRQQFPIVDQVEFRRILGQNEIVSSWSWPELKYVSAVLDTLSERKTRLQSQINTLQIDANRSGIALESFAKLERNAKVAEATYTVLIEQVKAQSMIAGFRPNNTEIYEYASASISPSSPKRNLILVIGAALGIFIGTALSILLAYRRGVYYSKSALKNEVQAQFTASARALKPLRKKSLADLNKMIHNKPRSYLRDMAVGIHKSLASQVVVTSSQAKLKGNDAARAIASYMQSETIKVAIIDFSSKAQKLCVDEKKLSVESFIVTDSIDNISILMPNSDLPAIELLRYKDFLKNIQSLNSAFDLVFLCADNGEAISLLTALEGQKAFHITLARSKKTKSATLKFIHTLLPIQGLLYD